MADFKGKIEKNAFFVLFGCVVTSVVISAGVQQYFYKQRADLANAKCQAAVEDANSKLASIERGISGSDYLDLKKLLYTSADPLNLPEKAHFFSTDQFYASSSDSDWDYSSTTELGFMGLLGEMAIRDIPRSMREIASLQPVHLWKSKTAYDVKGSDQFETLFGCITLERIPISRMRETFKLRAQMADEESESRTSSIPISKDDTPEKWVANLDRVFMGDVVGFVFSSSMKMQEHASLYSPEMGFYIVKMQKVGNVLYCQTLVTLKDVTVNGKPYHLYYIRYELLIVSTPENVYVVTIFVPSSDPAPRGKIYSAVNSWLSTFRIRIS